VIILGLHKDPWHNAGAAVIRDDGNGAQFANLAEERLDRDKDSRAFPQLSTEACLKQVGATIDDVDLVVMDHIISEDWRKDFYKRRCREDTFLANFPAEKIHVINHHLAHAHAVFYSSPYESAAILIVDGRGSKKETQSLFLAGPDGIKLLESTTTIGIGLLYAAVTQAIGFGLLQEGKTMGLAPYGAHVPGPIFDIPEHFNGIVTDYSSLCIEDSYDMAVQPSRPLTTFDDKARAAYDVQVACENAMLHLARHAKEVTGARNLCISGGVALNSVANYKILQTGLFDDVFINPAASDTGIPLGAALYGYHAVAKGPRTYGTISPYLGPDYGDNDIEAAIREYSGNGFTVQRDNAFETAIEMLVANRIVASFTGRSEMGPRALGGRSILMSPLLPENKDILNSQVKHREAFRPFAPAILEEHTSEYFEIDRPCPYMLMVPQVKQDKQSVIPAVTHVDGSARLQTVGRDLNPRFYSLISEFGRRTGVPVLLNTSFNVNKEPIVETPADAIRCFTGTGIDALLLGDVLLVKNAG
jgi:carbamoyltransferase